MVYWEIPIAPLTKEEMGVCIEKLDFRDYGACLKRIEGSVHVTLTEKAYCMQGYENEIEPEYYKMKALFEENNIHLKQVGIRDVSYSEMVRTPVDMVGFAQKNALSPANRIVVKIGDANVSFGADGFFAWWRGRIDVEAMKAQAMAMI